MSRSFSDRDTLTSCAFSLLGRERNAHAEAVHKAAIAVLQSEIIRKIQALEATKRSELPALLVNNVKRKARADVSLALNVGGVERTERVELQATVRVTKIEERESERSVVVITIAEIEQIQARARKIDGLRLSREITRAIRGSSRLRSKSDSVNTHGFTGIAIDASGLSKAHRDERQSGDESDHKVLHGLSCFTAFRCLVVLPESIGCLSGKLEGKFLPWMIPGQKRFENQCRGKRDRM